MQRRYIRHINLGFNDPRHIKEQLNDQDVLKDAYKWILEDESFVNWKEKDGRLLWIKGGTR